MVLRRAGNCFLSDDANSRAIPCAAVKRSRSARSLFGAFRRASRLSRSRLHQSWRNPTIAYLAMSSRFIDGRYRPIGLYRMDNAWEKPAKLAKTLGNLQALRFIARNM